MAVHTCPRCDLRFELDVEVVDHLAEDHGVDRDSLRTKPRPDLPEPPPSS